MDPVVFVGRAVGVVVVVGFLYNIPLNVAVGLMPFTKVTQHLVLLGTRGESCGEVSCVATFRFLP